MNHKEIMEKIGELVQQIAELKEAAQKQYEPKAWKPKNGEEYWLFQRDGKISSYKYFDEYVDRQLFKLGNCFQTKKRAEEVAKKIRMLLKLEQYHDMFCPDYVPDWSSDDGKYIVCYDKGGKRWDLDTSFSIIDAAQVYFDSKETAQKVCDLLNGEDDENGNELDSGV